MAAKGRVHVYVGTRKGGYVVESDGARRKWSVSGPFQPGQEVFHVAPDPRRPGDAYALVNSVFFGPMVYRSTDHGHKWSEIATPLIPPKSKRPPLEGGPDPSRFPIVNLWHIEPGPESEPSSLLLGVDPASLFRSDDRGRSWTAVTGLNEHETRPKWNPGAGGMCLHTIIVDPENPRRMYVGISAAGTFKTEDGGEHWRPANRGVKVSFLPEKEPEVGQCVHHVAIDPSDPSTFYRQDHDGIYVSHDRMDSWKHVGRSLPHDFGFVTAAPRALPGSAFFVPLFGYTRTTWEGGLHVYRWDDTPRKWSQVLKPKQFPGEFGTHREGLAADSLDPAGLYLGTTTGQLFVSPDAGRSWLLVPHQFPAIHSVSVESPADRA
jgi:hypothetical protein